VSLLRPHLARVLAIRALAAAALLGSSMLAALPGPSVAAAANPPPADYAALVDPLLGTGNGQPSYGIGNEGGHVFPGAAFPEGMVQWSPDTTSAAGGYRYEQPIIHGFSLTHFSGRGCSSYQDIPFLPIPDPAPAAPLSALQRGVRFSHAHEQATPGYYAVRLNNGIAVSLTVTARTGMAGFVFPGSAGGNLLINAGGSANGDDAKGTGIQVDRTTQVTGSAASGHFCGNNQYRVFFAARFNQPFDDFGVWNGGNRQPGARAASGARSGAYLHFAHPAGGLVLAKVGLSFVSVANALQNLTAENPGWDFNQIRTAATAAWNRSLGRIEVRGGTTAERSIFYTALYHTQLHPNVFGDVNGQYLGFDGHVHQAVGYIQYENFAGWDTYRSLIPLRAMLDPRAMGDMAQSLLADAAQGGGGLPRWQVANDNSGGMIGDSQDVTLATAYAFGARGFDAATALRVMERGASVPGVHSSRDLVREGLSGYLQRGYVDQATPGGSAAITLEYETDDFAISRLALALGDPAAASLYLQRSNNWRRLFDPRIGYIVPRDPAGHFLPFNPRSDIGFREGDSAQYTWMIPFDPRGLFSAMGGDQVAIARLDRYFQKLNAGPNSIHEFMGNEPDLEVPWEYDFAGVPARTQAVTRRIVTSLFTTGPNGLPGNDDSGALSAWLVWADLGLYPEIPGVAGFTVGSPLFPQAVVHLPGGDLKIVGSGAGAGSPFVQSLRLNGTPVRSPWLAYSALRSGGTLTFSLGPRPNPAWGASPTVAPPSYGP